MKELTDRKDIAKVINFGKYPVLRIDMSNPANGWTDVFYGCKVRIGTDKEYFGNAVLKYFGDEKHFVLTMNGACLSERFGYGDLIEITEFGMAPIVHAGDTVVVIEDYPETEQYKVHMMRVPSRINLNSIGVTLEELD